MSLVDLQHQPRAHRLVQRALARERVPHAYIFHGPEGVGKESFARGLAQLLLCPRPVIHELGTTQAATMGIASLKTGCGNCEDCRAVFAETHPDLHLIYRQLNRDHPDPEIRNRKGVDLGVDVIRHFLIDKVVRTAQRGRAKVFIVREADNMTVQAQNALLKTLEEPPGAAFIILLATALDPLLPTTQSRCQVVGFDALPTDFIQARLDLLRPGLAVDQAEWYARYGAGSIGAALEAVDDELFAVAEQVRSALARGGDDAGALTERFTSESKSLGEKYRKRDADISDTEAVRQGLATLIRLAADHFAGEIRLDVEGRDAAQRERRAKAINRLAQAERQLDANANVQLVVEALANELIRLR